MNPTVKMVETPSHAESDHSPRPPSSETRAPSPERMTKGLPKRSVTPHRHIFSDFGEAHRKITRSAATDPFLSPFDGNESNKDVSSPSMRCRSPPFALQGTRVFPTSLQQNAASGFSQVYPEVKERGRCLTGRRATSAKTIADISPSNDHSVKLSTTGDLKPIKKGTLPTIHASNSTVDQIVRQYATNKTTNNPPGLEDPAQGSGLQLPKTRRAKDKDGGSDDHQHNKYQFTTRECDGPGTGDTDVSPPFPDFVPASDCGKQY